MNTACIYEPLHEHDVWQHRAFSAERAPKSFSPCQPCHVLFMEQKSRYASPNSFWTPRQVIYHHVMRALHCKFPGHCSSTFGAFDVIFTFGQLHSKHWTREQFMASACLSRLCCTIECRQLPQQILRKASRGNVLSNWTSDVLFNDLCQIRNPV